MSMYIMKYGTKIRSYDFAGNTECYAEGRVVSNEGGYINFLIDKEVWCGESIKTRVGMIARTSIFKDYNNPNRIVELN